MAASRRPISYGRGVANAGVCLDFELIELGNKVRIKLPMVAR
jgi:hypothetical protein